MNRKSAFLRLLLVIRFKIESSMTSIPIALSCSQFKDVIAYEAIVSIYIGLFCEGIERASCKSSSSKPVTLPQAPPA